MPVGSGVGAEASVVWLGMLIQIVQDNIIGYVSACGGEISSRPEPLSPEAFADVFELLLYFARRPALHSTYEVAYADVRRYFHEHMDMVARQGTVDDLHPHFCADLPDDFTDPQADIAVQNFVPIFGRPDDMITVVIKCVTTCAVCHSVYP
jgi:hypothetical protein